MKRMVAVYISAVAFLIFISLWYATCSGMPDRTKSDTNTFPADFMLSAMFFAGAVVSLFSVAKPQYLADWFTDISKNSPVILLLVLAAASAHAQVFPALPNDSSIDVHPIGRVYADTTVEVTYQDSTGFYVIAYTFNPQMCSIPATNPPGCPHYYAQVQVYRVVDGRREKIGKDFVWTYTRGRCFEDVPRTVVDHALELSGQAPKKQEAVRLAPADTTYFYPETRQDVTNFTIRIDTLAWGMKVTEYELALTRRTLASLWKEYKAKCYADSSLRIALRGLPGLAAAALIDSLRLDHGVDVTSLLKVLRRPPFNAKTWYEHKTPTLEGFMEFLDKPKRTSRVPL